MQPTLGIIVSWIYKSCWFSAVSFKIWWSVLLELLLELNESFPWSSGLYFDYWVFIYLQDKGLSPLLRQLQTCQNSRSRRTLSLITCDELKKYNKGQQLPRNIQSTPINIPQVLDITQLDWCVATLWSLWKAISPGLSCVDPNWLKQNCRLTRARPYPWTALTRNLRRARFAGIHDFHCSCDSANAFQTDTAKWHTTIANDVRTVHDGTDFVW